MNGKKGVWGHAIGDMGAITQAMAKAAVAYGVDIRLSTRVRQVRVENGRAIGVETDKGKTIRAAAVAAGINPKLLFLHLVDPSALPEGFRRRIENWRCESGTFRMNVALSELPDFTALPGRASAEHHASGIIIGPSLAYMEQAYFDARSFGWSRRSIIELVIPSTIDDTLAPRGQHVASLFCQHVAPQLPDGSSWDDHRETVAHLMIETVNDHAPNFRRSVLARQIFSPLDLERTFGLVGGDIFHGALDLGQIFSARPMLGYADYRGPIAGLYLCGSGGHPGGGVTGAPGHNAAREILRDFKRALIEESEASPKVLAVYADIKATRKTDWINTFWKALANRKRMWDNITQVMAPGALDPLAKELIYIAVSITNNCNYCIASHTASARAKGMTDEQLAELLAVTGLANETNRLAIGYNVPVAGGREISVRELVPHY